MTTILTVAQQDLLKLIEECSEVQHICCKILKYGWDYVPGAHYPDKAGALQAELSDLKRAIHDVEYTLNQKLENQTG